MEYPKDKCPFPETEDIVRKMWRAPVARFGEEIVLAEVSPPETEGSCELSRKGRMT